MSGALLSGNNYCGFDPNPELFAQLKAYKTWLVENNQISKDQRCGLYKQGSEIYRPELSGLFDVSFTSPPYFNLESYGKEQNASTRNYDNYNLWLNEFVYPTVENTYKYLKVGGYAMINIKNLTRGKREPLFDDWYKAFMFISGFEPVEIFEMEQTSVKVVGYHANYNPENYSAAKEPVMSFRKVR